MLINFLIFFFSLLVFIFAKPFVTIFSDIHIFAILSNWVWRNCIIIYTQATAISMLWINWNRLNVLIKDTLKRRGRYNHPISLPRTTPQVWHTPSIIQMCLDKTDVVDVQSERYGSKHKSSCWGQTGRPTHCCNSEDRQIHRNTSAFHP